jgi:hypothetical protein
MTITAEDIEAEHAAAIASLTPPQLRALARLRNAKQATHFSGGGTSDALRVIFVREAEARTQQLAEADADRRAAA